MHPSPPLHILTFVLLSFLFPYLAYHTFPFALLLRPRAHLLAFLPLFLLRFALDSLSPHRSSLLLLPISFTFLIAWPPPVVPPRSIIQRTNFTLCVDYALEDFPNLSSYTHSLPYLLPAILHIPVVESNHFGFESAMFAWYMKHPSKPVTGGDLFRIFQSVELSPSYLIHTSKKKIMHQTFVSLREKHTPVESFADKKTRQRRKRRLRTVRDSPAVSTSKLRSSRLTAPQHSVSIPSKGCPTLHTSELTLQIPRNGYSTTEKNRSKNQYYKTNPSPSQAYSSATHTHTQTTNSSRPLQRYIPPHIAGPVTLLHIDVWIGPYLISPFGNAI